MASKSVSVGDIYFYEEHGRKYLFQVLSVLEEHCHVYDHIEGSFLLINTKELGHSDFRLPTQAELILYKRNTGSTGDWDT